ncbi:efflux RND transporter permease subunit [Marinicrinis lubricantis]|uniref:Efflux RND transporter permease subunit n=1 Tax=Marinicrinis lubricantis TaxID=2086470 RepID=A0ABW1IK48_9BACL
MTWFTKWAFKNKAAIILLIFMSIGIGIMSYAKMPMELLPEADNPQITITAIGPGYNAKSMEQQVTSPLEDSLQFVKGKTEMLSTSGDGYSQINLFYDSKMDLKEAKQEAQEAISAVQLPEGVMKPYVLLLNTSMIPVAQITVAFDDGLTDENMKLAETTIVNELKKIKGVAGVSLYGKTSPNVMIVPNQEKLTELGIPAQTLFGVLQGQNISASIGEQTIDNLSGNIQVTSQVNDLATLENLPVVPGVLLKDVAAVQVDSSQESVSRMNGKEILALDITKESTANQVAVGKALEERIAELNEEIPNVDIDVILNLADTIQSSVQHMMQEVLLGALFATIVILLFLRNFKATLITIVSIPLSLGITLYLLDLSGITLNIITLGGVAVAVGRLVDDSIVVIENIFRRMQKESFSIQMVIDATKEVAGAITSSTITTVAVFLPMGLLRGSLQAFLLPFALTISYSLLASLLVALTVVPILSFWLLKNSKMKEHEGPKRFNAFLKWNLNHKWVPIVLAVVLFVGSIGAYIAMPKGALDASDASYVTANLQYPSDTPVETVLEKGGQLEQFLMEQEEAEFVIMSNGNSAEAAQWGSVTSPTLVSYTIVVKKGTDAENLIEHIEAQKSEYEGADLSVATMSLMSGSSTSIYVDFLGGTEEERAAAAQAAMEKIQDVEGVLKVSSNMEETKPVFSFEVDPALANAQEVASQLQMMMNPIPIGQMTLNDNTSQVYVDALIQPKTQQDLNRLQISTAEGVKPISEVAELVMREEASSLYHQSGKNYVRVTAQVDPEKVSVVGADITKVTNDIELPGDVEMKVGGASADQSQDFIDLFVTMLISIGIVYLIMVITFKTLRAPIAILISLPLAFIGAVVGLIVTGITPDFTAAFGALMLIGIVVTNAIVLIDKVKQNEEHMTIRDSIVEAASVRMRPILMTAIATICAMMPLLFSKTEEGSIVSQSLATVVIGGLASATVLTLVIVPVFYEMLYFRKSKKQRKAAAQGAASSM